MNCPVCPAQDLPENCTCCPVCRADLQPLQRVRQLYLAQLAEAQRLFDLGLIDTALHHAAAALALNPKHAPALKLLGRLFWRKGMAQEALSRWDEAARLDPGDAELRTLLDDTRTQLQARETRRWRRRRLGWCGLVLAVLVAVLYAVLYINPRLESLAARTGDLEGAASRAAGAGPQPRADEPAAAKALEDLLVQTEMLRRQQDALSNLQQQTTAQWKTTADAVVADRQQIGALEAGLADARALATNVTFPRLQELSNAASAVLTRIEALEGGLRAIEGTQAMAAAQAQSTMHVSEESQAAVRATRRDVLALQQWITNTAQAAVGLLQPAVLEDLATQIAAAREELARLQREPAPARDSRGVFDTMAGLRAEGRVRAAQKRLAVLEAEWHKHAEPWLRFKTFISTNLQPLAVPSTPPAAGSGNP